MAAWAPEVATLRLGTPPPARRHRGAPKPRALEEVARALEEVALTH